MSSTAKAFAPGHITGFFQIRDRAKDYRKKGSRGAGICLSKGVITEVNIKKAEKRKIEIYLNGKKARAEVTRNVAEELVGARNLHITIKSEIQLPISQGLGMSAAGALSSALALNKALGLELHFDKVVEAAHKAEIACRTGLGDVLAQTIGGFEIRKKEGLLPYGKIDNISWSGNEIVICIVGKEIKTKAILTNPECRAKINMHGAVCMKKLIANPTIENFFSLSYDFAVKTGLADEKVISAIRKIEGLGIGAQAMLGNTVFATGATKGLVSILRRCGKVYVCSVGNGAKII